MQNENEKLQDRLKVLKEEISDKDLFSNMFQLFLEKQFGLDTLKVQSNGQLNTHFLEETKKMIKQLYNDIRFWLDRG